MSTHVEISSPMQVQRLYESTEIGRNFPSFYPLKFDRAGSWSGDFPDKSGDVYGHNWYAIQWGCARSQEKSKKRLFESAASFVCWAIDSYTPSLPGFGALAHEECEARILQTCFYMESCGGRSAVLDRAAEIGRSCYFLHLTELQWRACIDLLCKEPNISWRRLHRRVFAEPKRAKPTPIGLMSSASLLSKI